MGNILPPLEANDVSQGASKQLGLVAQAQTVAPIHGSGSTLDRPRVSKTLPQLGQVAVEFFTKGHEPFAVQRRKAVAATQVDQLPAVVVELAENLADWRLALTGADASLKHPHLGQLIPVPQVDERVVVVRVLLVGPNIRSQSSDL